MTGKKVLRDCEVFASLSDEALERIAGSALEKQYAAGLSIFSEGESDDELYVLEEGKVALQMTLQNDLGKMRRRISVDIVSANEIIGWPTVIGQYTHTLTAVCLQNTRVLSINGNNLRWFLQDNPAAVYEVLKGVIKVVASRLEETRRLLISERTLPPS